MIGKASVALLLAVASISGCGEDPRSCPNDLPDGAVCPSYAAQVAPLVQQRCAPCHFPGGIEYPLHDFSSWASVYRQRVDILNQVHACNMPPAWAPQLDTMERFILQSWLVCGAPDN